MKAFYLTLIFIASVSVYSGDDSLKAGSKSTITLNNGFEITGVITRTSGDTVFMLTKDREIAILRSSIRSESFFAADEEVNVNTVDTSDECHVYLSNGILKKDVRLLFMNDSSILTVRNKKLNVLSVADIRKIKFPAGGGFTQGAMYGSMAGFAVGGLYFIALAEAWGGNKRLGDYFDVFLLGGIIGSVPAALIGGLIGAMFDKDVNYVFPSGNSPAKLKRIRYIISKHS